jgi:hypothetical protein
MKGKNEKIAKKGKSLGIKVDLIDLKVIHILFTIILNLKEISVGSFMVLEVGFGDSKIAVKSVLPDTNAHL